MGKSFHRGFSEAYGYRGRGYVQNSGVFSDSHLENWSLGVLISVILIVLITVSLQLWSQFVPIFLRPVLRTVAAYIVAIVWSSCS